MGFDLKAGNTVHPVETMLTTGYQTTPQKQYPQNEAANHKTERRPKSSVRSGATVPIFHQTDPIIELDENKHNEVSKNAESEEPD